MIFRGQYGVQRFYTKYLTCVVIPYSPSHPFSSSSAGQPPFASYRPPRRRLPLARPSRALSSLFKQIGSTKQKPKMSWRQRYGLKYSGGQSGKHEQPFSPSLSARSRSCPRCPFVLNLPHSFPPLYPCSLSPHPPYLRYLSGLSTQPLTKEGA